MERASVMKMGNIIDKITKFLKNIFFKSTIKQLEPAKEATQINENNTQNEEREKEKKRIFDLYNKVKNETIKLEQIEEKEDLIKIRKLLLEEAKLQNKIIEKDINKLQTLINSTY